MDHHVVNFRVNPDPDAQGGDKWAVLTEPGRPYPWKTYPGGDMLSNSETEDWLAHRSLIPAPERKFRPGDLVEVKTGYDPFRAVRIDDYWWAPFDERCLGKDSFLDGKEYTYIGNTLEMKAA